MRTKRPNKRSPRKIGGVKMTVTAKQAKFLALWLQHGNGTAAALEAYDTDDPHAAGNIASEVLAKLGDKLTLFCEVNGISFKTLFDKNKQLFDAKKIHGTNDNFIEVPDYAVQEKALDRFERWLSVKQIDTQNNLQINVQPILGGASSQPPILGDEVLKVMEVEQDPIDISDVSSEEIKEEVLEDDEVSNDGKVRQF